MFRSYFKVAFRSMFRNKGFTLINIFGLAIGMACTLLIFLFVKDEQSYDRYHRDSDRIYRIVKDFINDDGSRIPDATTPAALAPALMTRTTGNRKDNQGFSGLGCYLAHKIRRQENY